jgi:hypothetical protein
VTEYVAPNNPNCRIQCPDTGGAVYIPPYTCHTWCDNAEPATAAFISGLGSPDGWDFRSSLTAKFRGGQVSEIASAILNIQTVPIPPPSDSTLASLATLGSLNPSIEFHVVWENENFRRALMILLSELLKAILS